LDHTDIIILYFCAALASGINLAKAAGMLIDIGHTAHTATLRLSALTHYDRFQDDDSWRSNQIILKIWDHEHNIFG